MADPYRAPALDNAFGPTPGDMRRQRISGALGWDTGPGGWDPAYAARELGNRAWMLGLTPAVGRIAPRAAPTPQGAWSPPPAAPPRVGVAQPQLWEDMVAGRWGAIFDSSMNLQMNPQRWMRNDLPQLAKGVGAIGGAVGAGTAGGSYLSDTLGHGLDPSTASWNAAVRAVRAPWRDPGPAPAWWPGQPQQEQRPDPLEPTRRGMRATISISN